MMMPSDELMHGRLLEVLDYDSTTGIFTWREGRHKGARAGTITNRGYRQIKIDQLHYTAGRLAVFWMTGHWPKDVVDHANMITDDNRWCNLREATHGQNHANAHDVQSAVPFKGVTYDKRTGQFMAQIRVDYRNIFLGRFDDPKQAHLSYVAAAQKHFGKFARST